MRPAKLLTFCTISITTFALAGCVAVHRVHYDDAPRTHVQFDSLTAFSTFFNGVLDMKFPARGKHGRILVGQTLYRSETRPSANVVFNAAVAAADVNQDGLISGSEAHTFAQNSKRRP